jgi:kumamolisin
VRAVRQVLKVPLKRVSTEGAEYIATDAAPVVPAAIAAEIEGINGLQPYLHLNKMIRFAPKAEANPDGGATPFSIIKGHYFPGGILRAYQALPYLSQNGAGTTTAILIDTFPNTSDLTNFWSLTGVPQTLSNITFIQTASGTLPAPSGEETLDTEYSSGIGYGSKVRVYATTSLAFTKLDTGYQRILTDLQNGIKIQQMSVSLGGCEVFVLRGEWMTENNLLSLIAAKNVTIFISSGDSGAFECTKSNPPFPSWPSTSPFVTAVGGTSLITQTVGTNKLAIVSETGWSGSGGGFSNLFDPPSYQAFLKPSSRVVPDVAADADPNTGVDIVFNGQETEIGGTSASSPIWAGFASLINQARTAAGKSLLGQLNPRIYPLLGTANFHDVTAGSNGYSAGKGYDLVTGIGSPIMNKLLPTLLAQP